jgi:hypothetical protein
VRYATIRMRLGVEDSMSNPSLGSRSVSNVPTRRVTRSVYTR